jgi:hypothetical protein
MVRRTTQIAIWIAGIKKDCLLLSIPASYAQILHAGEYQSTTAGIGSTPSPAIHGKKDPGIRSRFFALICLLTHVVKLKNGIL